MLRRSVAVLSACVVCFSFGSAAPAAEKTAKTMPAEATAKTAAVPAAPEPAGKQSPAKEPPAAKDGPSDEKYTLLEEWMHKLHQGGNTVIVQIVLSVFGLGVVLERLYRLRRSQVVPAAFLAEVDRLWAQGWYGEIESLCGRTNNAAAQVLETVVRHRNAGFETVSTIAGDVASRAMRRQMQRLYPVAVVATLEPLLGLFGTVLGMIGAFDTVAQAGTLGNASILADDIAKALVTTAVGLVIAIPALFLYQFLKNRLATLSAILEEEVSDRISAWLVLGTPKQGNGEPASVEASVPATAAEPSTPAAS